MRYLTSEEFNNIDVEYNHAVLCGAGHVARSVAALLPGLGFKVTIIDNRPQVADEARSLNAEVICDDFAVALDSVKSDNNTYYIVSTYGHSYDYECLCSILPKKSAYIGLLSSHSKSAYMKERLKKEGFDSAQVDALNSPIGLSIKAHTPEEIAISIAAQIILTKNSASLISFGRPFINDDMKDFVSNSEGPCVMATIVKKEGSAPRDVGTAFVLNNSGRFCGTIGGGSIEEGCKQVAAQILNSSMKEFSPDGEPLIHVYDTANIRTDSPVSDIKCGGKVTVEFFLIDG